MKLQLHHQHRSGKMIFVSQRELQTQEQVFAWAKEMELKHPPPREHRAVVVTEESPLFVRKSEDANRSKAPSKI